MSSRCPDGHDSTAVDYCSVCGLAMSAGGAAGGVGAATPTPTASALVTGGGTCANCGEPHGPDDVFCENCGLDFASGTLPAADPEPAVTSLGAGADPVAAPGAQVATITLTVDRAHHARMDSEGVLAYPDPEPGPVDLPVHTPVVTIGRAKPARGVHPDIDLAAPTHEDPAASTRHAVIEQRPDGTWWITDLGSTNGTFLGDAADTQLAPDTPTKWPPGTPVFVGAWTKLVLTLR